MARPIPLQRFLTRLVALSILPVFLFAGWLAYEGIRNQQAETDREAENLAHNFAAALDQHLSARIAALNVLANTPLVGSDRGYRRLYQAAQAFQQQFDSHVILGEVGNPIQMLFNTRQPYGTVLPSLPRPEGFAAAPAAIASGLPAVGDLVMGNITREPLVAIAVPVLAQGKVSHVLLATFDAAHFRQRAELLALPEGWRLRLLDGLGATISERGQPFGQSASSDVVSVRHPLKMARWSVVVEIPQPVYLAPLYASGVVLALGLFAIGLIAVIGGTLASRRLGRAVDSLENLDVSLANETPIQEILAVRERLKGTERLRNANEALEHRVAERTVELANARDRIARFAIDQERRIEAERRRVAREVHDQLGQIFTGLQMIVQTLPRDALAPAQAAALQGALELGIAGTRRIAADLRPPLLDDLGFASAIEHFAREAAKTGGFDIELQIADSAPCAEQSLLLYRIVQEAVTNIMRHARASHVLIAGDPDGDDYRLRIDDDGRGFDPGRVRRDAMGLLNMRERAALLGGDCRIEHRPGGGTRVEARLPLHNKKERDADQTAAR